MDTNDEIPPFYQRGRRYQNGIQKSNAFVPNATGAKVKGRDVGFECLVFELSRQGMKEFVRAIYGQNLDGK